MTEIDACWSELGRREKLLRDTYNELKIVLRPGQGMAKALDEAKALAEGVKSEFSDAALLESVQACHIVYSIADNVEICLDAGMDVSRQLGCMAMGSADYGTPGSTSDKSIYLKDFEFELFIAASLVRGGLKPEFLDNPSDPMGEMQVEGIVIECKHPDSTGSLKEKVRKFAKKLRESKRFGLFAVAVEDAHRLGDRTVFESRNDHDEWLEQKQLEMERSGLELAEFASYWDVVLGLIHAQTKVTVVGGESGMTRHSTSTLFDRPDLPDAVAKGRWKIAQVFNPAPRHFASPSRASSRKDTVSNGQSSSEPMTGD